MLAHDGLDGLGSLVSVVEGDAADVVVQNVGLDDAVEEVSADESHLTINGGSGAADKVPFLVSVVGESRIGVLKEGDCHKPVVNPEIWDKVPDSHVVPAKLLAEQVQTSHGQTNANVAHDDKLSVAVLIERAAGVEVVDATTIAVLLTLTTTLTLALMVVVAGDIGHEIVGPANELLTDEHGESEERGLLGELRHLMNHLAEAGSMLLASSGDKDHITLHVSSSLVVLSVRDLPAEVGDKESGVENPAGDIVDEARVGEGAVTALVGQNPDTGGKKTLKDGVDSPEASSDRGRGDVFGSDKVVPDGKGRAEKDEIAEDIAVSPQGGALEAVLGDGIVDILDGEVGGSELVAICVKKTTVAIAWFGDFGL